MYKNVPLRAKFSLCETDTWELHILSVYFVIYFSVYLLSTLLTFPDSISAFGKCGQAQWLQTTLTGFSEGQ